MAYATLDDMEVRYGKEEIQELTDRDNDGTNDSGVVDSALNDASSEIDSYLGVRYSIPILSVSENLKRICCDIARFRLFEDHATEEVDKRYSRAIAWLKDIAAGKAILTEDSGQPIDQDGGISSSAGVQSFSNDRLFSDETLAGF